MVAILKRLTQFRPLTNQAEILCQIYGLKTNIKILQSVSSLTRSHPHKNEIYFSSPLSERILLAYPNIVEVVSVMLFTETLFIVTAVP